MNRSIAIVILSILLSACGSNMGVITDDGSQLRIRQIQTREYDGLSKQAAMRSILATYQDLGFVIDKADYELATITGTKLQGYQIRMTVTVRGQEGQRLAVRANARFNEKLIEDPATYQDFFAALNKAMFLTRHEVD